MRVSEVMNTDVVPLAPGDPVRVAARLLAEYRIRGLPVIDDRKVVGVVTERQIMDLLTTHVANTSEFVLPSPFEVIEYLLRRVGEKVREVSEKDIGSVSVESIMVRDVPVVDPHLPIEDAAALLTGSGSEIVVVLKDGQYIGVVSEGDIIHGLAHM